MAHKTAEKTDRKYLQRIYVYKTLYICDKTLYICDFTFTLILP